MTERWVCRWCVLKHGIKGSDLANWPSYDDLEAQSRHIEKEHHIPVQRKGETAQQALLRHHRENPDASTENCKCPACENMRAMLARIGAEGNRQN